MAQAAVGDWRFPNVRELQSLLDYGNAYPALPSGHPFFPVLAQGYWSSTTWAQATNYAFVVNLFYGHDWPQYKLETYWALPVRVGQ